MAMTIMTRKQEAKTGKRRSRIGHFYVASLLGINTLTFLTPCEANASGAAQDNRTEIVFTDSQSAILRAGSLTGGPAVIAAGQKLVQPLGICVARDGEFIVTDPGCMGIIGVNPSSGVQRVVSSGGRLGFPFGIALERCGSL